MYARVLTYSGVEDIDAAVKFLRETALPVVRSQAGYQGLIASADRSGGVLGILSLWENVADRDASESALAKTREEARGLFGAELTVETFEERAVEVTRPPTVGAALMITRVAMDPASVADNVEFFRREVAPQIKAAPGFVALRNMINSESGEGTVGTVWENEQAMRTAAADAQARRGDAARRGVTLGDVSYREVLLIDLK